MKKVVLGSSGGANVSKMRNYGAHTEAIAALNSVKDNIAAKTSTAEKMENVSLDLSTGTYIYKHLWCGIISFDKSAKCEGQSTVIFDDNGNPELVVVGFMRYGDFGREVAPALAQVIQKWREIKKKHEKNDFNTETHNKL